MVMDGVYLHLFPCLPLARSFCAIALPLPTQPPFDVWTETPTGGTPNFLTGAGGFLQTAFNGYSGLRINASGAFLSPSLGEAMSSLGLHGVAFLGNRLDIDYNASEIRILLVAPTLDSSGAEDALVALWPPHPLSLLPRSSLAERSQRSRVRLGDGHTVPSKPLRVVDATGTSHALTAGVPLLLPTQPVSIVPA